MSSLLPILFDLQNGTTAIGGAEAGKESLGQVSKDQPKSSGLPLPPAFSQIFREQKNFRHDEALVRPDAVERTLNESQSSQIERSPAISLQSTPDSDIFPDSGSLLPTQFLDTLLTIPHNAVPERSQSFSLEQPTFPLSVPSTGLAAIERFQTPAAALFQNSGFQPTDGDPISGQVRQDILSASDPSAKVQVSRPQVFESGAIPQQIPLPKVHESGVVSQPASQVLAEKHTSVLLNREGESIARTVAPPAKDVLSGLEQVGGPVKQNETPRIPIPQSPLSPASAQSPTVPSNHTPHATAKQADSQVGSTDRVPISQPSIKPVLGIPSVSNEVPSSVSEHRTPIPVDLNGESVLLGKGDRTQNSVETSVRGIGLETSGGQGLGMGMNHSSNSQSGFQQQAPSSPGEGVGLRALEERRPDLPTPALQRLQMDVQLSENNRVHIDVGVHNRQVYAGLVMDHSVLKNLAAQFVPQLENQLSRVDLELQEFSAEVREEPQQQADTMFQDPQSHGQQETEGHSQVESSSTPNLLNRYQEHGLHLVA